MAIIFGMVFICRVDRYVMNDDCSLLYQIPYEISMVFVIDLNTRLPNRTELELNKLNFDKLMHAHTHKHNRWGRKL